MALPDDKNGAAPKAESLPWQRMREVRGSSRMHDVVNGPLKVCSVHARTDIDLESL